LADRVRKFSTIKGQALDCNSRYDKVKKISFQDVERESYALGFLKENFRLIERTFSIIDTETRSIPYQKKIQNAITYEINSTRMRVERTEYSLLELLGNVGGIYGVFFNALGPVLMMIFGVKTRSDMIIASELTDLNEKKDEENAEKLFLNKKTCF